MTKLHCPICDKTFDANDENAAMPFCSSRCKLIDATRWLDEAYGMPIEPEEDQILNTKSTNQDANGHEN